MVERPRNLTVVHGFTDILVRLGVVHVVDDAVVGEAAHVGEDVLEPHGEELVFVVGDEDAVDVGRVIRVGGNHEFHELVIAEDDEMRPLLDEPDVLDARK